jgi:tetratricopeptide (TPR) repeat protein
MKKHIILLSTLGALAACGGSPKSGLKGGNTGVPPPPQIQAQKTTNTNPKTADTQEPKRVVSTDARKDYQAAYAFFMQNEGKWNESACKGAADKFQSVVSAHADLVEAQFMVGLSYERCNLLEDAEKAYQQASRMNGDSTKKAMAVSSLGELYFRAGKLDGAKQYWDTAIKANGKLVGARIGVASIELEQMRKIHNAKDAGWQKLEEDARFNLSSALGVDTDSVEAYTAYGLVYMEGWEQNRNRLDLAKTLLDEAKKRNEKYAPLQNAYGLWYMHKGRLNEALAAFQAAVDADPRFLEPRLNAGQLNLGFRKYDLAKDLFAKALELAPKNYDAVIGLGFAQRGLNDFDGAEASYKKAISIDGRKGDAYYNLGVLYKGFKATHAADLPTSIKLYDQAKGYFQQFLDKDGDKADKDEAKNNIADCDKVTKQLQDFIKAQANMPPPPPAPAAPAQPAPAGGAAPAPAPGK